MKNKNNYLILLLVIAFAFSCLFMISCGGNDEENNGSSSDSLETTVIDFEISKETLFINQYENYKLTIRGTTEKATWSSTNTAVAVVDENGMITAISAGETTIIAKIGDQEKTCSVTVQASSIVPQINASVDRNNTLLLGTSYNLNISTISYDGRTYECDFSYISSNPSVLSVDNNGLVNALAIGEAVITVNATWRGSVIVESFAFQVITADMLSLESNSVTLAKSNIESYSNSAEISATLIINGQSKSDIEFIYEVQDESIATVDVNGIILAKEIGTTTIVVKTSYEGKEFVAEVSVDVIYPIFDYNEVVTIDSSNTTYVFDSASIFGVVDGYSNEAIVKLEDAKTNEVIALNNGVLSINKVVPGETTWILYNQYFGVKFNANIEHELSYTTGSYAVNIGYSTAYSYNEDAWSTVMYATSWAASFKLAGEQINDDGFVVFYIYYEKEIESLAIGTSRKYTEGRIAWLQANTWNEIVLSVAQYNEFVANQTELFLTNGDNISKNNFYFTEPKLYQVSDNYEVVENANLGISLKTVYGEELSSTTMKATQWQIKFKLTNKITDPSVEKVIFFVNTDMVNPMYDLLLRIEGVGDNGLVANTWTRIELAVADYNRLVENGTVLKIDDGNGVNNKTFYFSGLYFEKFENTPSTDYEIEANAVKNISQDVVYGEETFSTTMKATQWQIKFKLTNKVTDPSVKKVVFYINTNMTNPMYDLLLRIEGVGEIKLTANTWTKIELDVAVYNQLVEEGTVLKIDDGNGVNNKTFYFSQLYFITE